MALFRRRFTVRGMMAVVALVGLALGGSRFRSERVLLAARGTVPGIIIQSVRSEIFNDESAWEVRGIDKQGTLWQLDISTSGEVLMKEPIAYGRDIPK